VKGPVAWSAALGQAPAWYAGPEAVRIADNVRLYQRRTGGWPKNIDMAQPLGDEERARVAADKTLLDSTLDNGATWTQLSYLARVFDATREERFKASVLEGLDFLLDAQYANGGWPQFYPLHDDYSRHITFNDLAMIGTMSLLGDVAESRPPFGFVDGARRARAADAIARGLRLVLATQIRVQGALTGWCAQYDETTLEPRGARTYQHASIDSRETADIARYLMRLPRPDPPVVEAVEGAIAWLRRATLSGVRVERRADPSAPLGYDVVVIPDPAAPPLWARFYEIGSNRPIFSGRDGVVKYRLSDIEYERRTNYGWLGTWPVEVVEAEYREWKTKR
jgi:PelA/Pel-15E family pectate lyase